MLETFIFPPPFLSKLQPCHALILLAGTTPALFGEAPPPFGKTGLQGGKE